MRLFILSSLKKSEKEAASRKSLEVFQSEVVAQQYQKFATFS